MRPTAAHLLPPAAAPLRRSDGLWDAVTNEEATQLALKHQGSGGEAAARALVAEAYSRGSQDNITAGEAWPLVQLELELISVAHQQGGGVGA